jgi:hypothetical protein
VLENFTRREIALFVLAFGVAGCLMAWSINLSIDRLLFADFEPKPPVPVVHIQSSHHEAPEYREARGQ